jgi:hypothetical protein
MDKLEDGTHLVNAVPDLQTIVNLQHDLGEIEAFAHAARALVDGLPRVQWPADGALVEAVADAARRARIACHDRLRALAAAAPAPVSSAAVRSLKPCRCPDRC